MIFDGTDLKYILEKHGFSLSDVAKQLKVTPQTVFLVVRGYRTSRRVITHIEKLLDMKPGTLVISRERRDELVKVA